MRASVGPAAGGVAHLDPDALAVSDDGDRRLLTPGVQGGDGDDFRHEQLGVIDGRIRLGMMLGPLLATESSDG